MNIFLIKTCKGTCVVSKLLTKDGKPVVIDETGLDLVKDLGYSESSLKKNTGLLREVKLLLDRKVLSFVGRLDILKAIDLDRI